MASLDETLEDFNDMGYMQAIDLITAIEAVKIILRENRLSFNAKRMIGYGHSHGAYLVRLCNRLVPHLFSFIIDNSAWIEPVYLFSNRYLYQNLGKARLRIEFDYLAKKVIQNKHNLNLEKLYQDYTGTAQIITFQGDNDNLVNHWAKKSLIESLRHSTFILVTERDIDHKKYKTNTHGLGADFLELFDYALQYESPADVSVDVEWNYSLNFDGVTIDVSNPMGLPVFKYQFSDQLH